MRGTYLLDREAGDLLAPCSNDLKPDLVEFEDDSNARGDLLDHFGGVGGCVLLRNWWWDSCRYPAR